MYGNKYLVTEEARNTLFALSRRNLMIPCSGQTRPFRRRVGSPGENRLAANSGWMSQRGRHPVMNRRAFPWALHNPRGREHAHPPDAGQTRPAACAHPPDGPCPGLRTSRWRSHARVSESGAKAPRGGEGSQPATTGWPRTRAGGCKGGAVGHRRAGLSMGSPCPPWAQTRPRARLLSNKTGVLRPSTWQSYQWVRD